MAVLRQRSDAWRRTKRSRCWVSSSLSHQRADHHAELVSGGCLGSVADKSQFIGAAFCPVPREWARPAGPPDASFVTPAARSLELHGSVFSALNLDDPVFRIALVFRFRRKIGHRVYEVARRRAVASALGGTIRIPVARAS
jgi:hypothetical protein